MTWTAVELHRCCSFSSFVVRAALHCVAIFIIVQALLQPMSLDADLEPVIATAELADLDADAVEWIYGNARGLRQGSGDFCQAIHTQRPTFFAACETHLDGDPIEPLIPSGYKVLCRLDRNKHGGGLIC